MKKLTYIVPGVILFLCSSFGVFDNDNAISKEILVGKWYYAGLTLNGVSEKIDQCDRQDYLILNAEGTFESLQHSSLLTNTDENSVQITCNPSLRKGKWFLDQSNLICQSSYNQTSKILELTYDTMKIQHVIRFTDLKFEKHINTYVETYRR